MIEVLLGYAAGAFEGAVLFTVRDQMAFGWKAVGDLPGRAYVEHLLIPLDAPSIVQAAVAAESGVFHGEVAPSTVNSYLHKVLGIAEPKYATAGVITIGKRVVNVLYGHGDELTADADRRAASGLRRRRRGVRATDRGSQEEVATIVPRWILPSVPDRRNASVTRAAGVAVAVAPR